MFAWIRNFFRKKEWNYIGTVTGKTVSRNTKEEINGYWILSECEDGSRKVKLVGDPGNSEYATYKRAQVESWIRGGPTPELDERFKLDVADSFQKLLE